jgi:hypothetical protein
MAARHTCNLSASAAFPSPPYEELHGATTILDKTRNLSLPTTCGRACRGGAAWGTQIIRYCALSGTADLAAPGPSRLTVEPARLLPRIAAASACHRIAVLHVAGSAGGASVSSIEGWQGGRREYRLPVCAARSPPEGGSEPAGRAPAAADPGQLLDRPVHVLAGRRHPWMRRARSSRTSWRH